MKQMDGVADADIEAISHANAMRHFSFDPFSANPKPDCTVGALRRRAAGHDVSIVARGRRGDAHQTKASDLSKLSRSSDR